jgi:hypothetical protein
MDSQDTTDTCDTFVSAFAVVVKEIAPSTNGALTTAPGGARAAVPPFIMGKLRAARDAMGVGSSLEPLPACFRGELFTVVTMDDAYDTFDANHHAYKGVKLTVLKWARQRRMWLVDGRLCRAHGMDAWGALKRRDMDTVMVEY